MPPEMPAKKPTQSNSEPASGVTRQGRRTRRDPSAPSEELSPFPTATVREKAFLIAVDTGADPVWTAEESLVELAALVETAGGDVVGSLFQNRAAAHPIWYLGSGKAQELKQLKAATGFNMLVADDELSPKQQRSLEKLLDMKVLDRSGLILDIFSQRARTHEGRLQVQLARLEYQLPRLTRMWTHLSRMGGGIGTRRGPGETQLETDRRVIRQRIKKMKEEVAGVRLQRETASRERTRRVLPAVAIVGYTNAGKSTLLNALVGKEVAGAEDKLFATLDPTSRRVELGEGQAVVVSDTVGFIHKLPHQLVDAFRATLEEVVRADVLVEVVDASDPFFREHRRTIQEVLDELGAGHKPRLVAYNKVDVVSDGGGKGGFVLPRTDRHAVAVSALTGLGLEALRTRLATVLAELWMEVDLRVPYTEGALLARVRERAVVKFEYRDRDVRVVGRVAPGIAAELVESARAWRRVQREAVSEEDVD
ncbi:MAG: GTPase HflX [Thermoleophilia bacterium]